MSAAVSGVVVARSGSLGLMVLGGSSSPRFRHRRRDADPRASSTLAATLGIVPELSEDDRLVGATSLVYAHSSQASRPCDRDRARCRRACHRTGYESRVVAGAPATLVLPLLVVALADVVWFSPILRGVFIARPLVLLLLALLIAYWTATRHGTGPPLAALVVAGMLAIPGGMFNADGRRALYYYASFVYVIGMAAILVFFELLDVGLMNIAFLLLSVLSSRSRFGEVRPSPLRSRFSWQRCSSQEGALEG